jgi:hypothetical protein
MRMFGTFLAAGIGSLVAGCDGGSSDSATSTATATSTTTSISTNTTTHTNTSTSTSTATSTGCNFPSCLADLLATCTPSGTCVEQVDLATYSSNVCYSNGVKELMSMDPTTGVALVTFKNGSTTCFTLEEVASASGTSSSLTIKNGSGQTVATGTNNSGGTTTITCTGGQPVTFDSSCDPTSAAATTDCAEGSCS